MRDLILSMFVCGLFCELLPAAYAQPNSPRFELSGLIGVANVPDTTFGTLSLPVSTLESTATKISWQANVAWHGFDLGPAAVFLEAPLTSAVSQNVVVATTLFGETHRLSGPNANTYFLTPGFRLRFLNNKRLSPFVAAGVGLESIDLQETKVIISEGSSIISIAAIRHGSRTYKGAFDVGGGLDLNLQRRLSLRIQFRDFLRMGQSSSQSGTATVFQDVLPSRHTFAPLAGVAFRF